MKKRKNNKKESEEVLAGTRTSTIGGSGSNTITAESKGASSGATGDVNTVAIQSALNQVGAAGGGTVIISTPGTYLLNTQGIDPYDPNANKKYCVSFDYDNVSLEIGEGVILKLADNQQIGSLVNNSAGAVNMFTWRNITNLHIYGRGRITGNTAGQTGWTGGYAQLTNGCIMFGHGLSPLSRNSNVLIEDLTLDDHFSNPINLDYGINIVYRNLNASDCGEGFQQTNSLNSVIEGCTYTDTTGNSGGDAFEQSDCVDCSISDCRAIATATGSTIGGGGLDIGRSTRQVVSNMFFIGNCQGGISQGTHMKDYSTLTVDHTLNTKVTSSSYNFQASDVGRYLHITLGTGFTVGKYKIASVASNAATLSSSPAAIDTSGADWFIPSNLQTWSGDGTGKTVFSDTHSFATTNIGKTLRITGGTSWTKGIYTIVSVASGRATLNAAPAASGTTDGEYLFGVCDETIITDCIASNLPAGTVACDSADGDCVIQNFKVVNSATAFYTNTDTDGVVRMTNCTSDSCSGPSTITGSRKVILNACTFNNSASGAGLSISKTGPSYNNSVVPEVSIIGGQYNFNAGGGIDIQGNGDSTFAPRLTVVFPEMRGNGSNADITTTAGTIYNSSIILQPKQTAVATNLVVDGAVNTRVSSVTYSFTIEDVGSFLDIPYTTNWTGGRYRIASITSTSANLDASPAAVGVTGGNWSIIRKGFSLKNGAIYHGTNNVGAMYGVLAAGSIQEMFRINGSNEFEIDNNLPLRTSNAFYSTALTADTSGIARSLNRHRFNGSLRLATTTKATSFTADANVSMYTVDSTSGSVTATMFTADSFADGMNGHIVTFIKLVAGNSMIIAAGAGQTINGGANVSVTGQYTSVTIVYDLANTNWVVISQKGT
jgi:hypothetical protein